MIKNRETTLAQRSTYYCYFFGQNMLYFIVSQFAMLYFTDYVGISAAVIGVIFLVARIWDAVNDPMFGIIVDKSNLKAGKYKAWINIASILLPIISLLVFCVPNISVTGKTVYIAVVYILWGMTYTVSDVPGFGMATAMSNNMEERNSMLATSRLFAIGALLILSMFIMKLVGAADWTVAALIIAVAGFIFMNLMRPVVQEKHKTRNDGITIKRIVSYLIHNKYLLIYYSGITILFACGTSMVASNYFAIYNLGSSSYIALLMMMSIVPMLLSAIIAPKLISKFGKYKVTVVSCAIGAVSSFTFFFVGYGQLIMVLVFLAISGMALGIVNVTYPMFTADCIEYGTWHTGERAAGISFSIQTFTTKLGQAIAAGLGAFMLTLVGYVPNAEQSERALKGIFSMMTILPAVGMIAMLIIFGCFYKLRESDVEQYIIENAKKLEI